MFSVAVLMFALFLSPFFRLGVGVLCMVIVRMSAPPGPLVLTYGSGFCLWVSGVVA
jgi:hypothetical protein